MEYTNQDILRLLPHRYPFLLVDKIVSVTPGESIVCNKNVTFNEPQFTGHFPEQPIMPGVLMIEALAQTCGLLGFYSIGEGPAEDTNYLLAGVDGVKVRRPVLPGDVLEMHAKITQQKRTIWRFEVRAEVEGAKVIEATLTLAQSKRKP
ncbi:MAG TPA: 3-hydroxyacyl-[acyl-carrier-protein] dehydratase FabZ [Gammaproteobacteria bacterium]|nr:3-hydroxyacyl-[acyl-carrier-protein] dehydratase FabZ [Gammaproteobacteria bacterium]MEC8012012.1 3-hydroxyacyl-ACP dehydratase FabZ [Pseudomonadota bacterium]HBF09821.1 3-hydroxyacyl-[acyl-carrier-protein] dehydratase FabZ [Gammaproteobacteria bacterium]HCK92440.1 3-hydroxyacyl-[acyl-carrier-protein] dehydratase FabZ [Gammaproteobacteria bacterium]|tara:strand:+ start:128 stop:574 length:447 start_codon:yes stop_codon:yes gene_type:complete